MRQAMTNGFFKLTNGFPDNDYYGFTDGELAMAVERNGGINTLTCLDILEFDGKLYPDRCPTPAIFQKEGAQCGKRPNYGPAVQFISTNTQPDGRTGRNLFHVPDEVELYPFGFRSASTRFGYRTTYDLAIIGRTVLFSFTNAFPTRRDLVINIDKNHLVQGEFGSMKNHLADYLRQLATYSNMGMKKEDFPFFDSSRVNQQWHYVGFDEKANGFLLDGVMRFSYGEKTVAALLTSDRKLDLTDTKYRYLLSTPWQGQKRIKLCLVIAGTKEEAVIRAKETLRDFDRIFSGKVRQAVRYSENAPHWKSRQYPEIEEVSRTAPSFLKSMIIVDREGEACIRGANYGYGYFMGPDQLYPAKAFAMMGDWDLAGKLLRHHATLPKAQMERMGQIVSYLTMTVEYLVGISGDQTFLNEMYPILKGLFEFLSSCVSTEGLISGYGAGVDDPAEAEQFGEIWCPDLNGWWHGACRAMENLALLRGDDATARKARDIAKRIEACFLDVFFAREKGYFVISVEAKTRKRATIYHNIATLGMESPYGEYLMHSRIRELAEFQAYQLYHPAGRSAVAYWDRADEMWHNCIMFQFSSALEMRTARAAGMAEEIMRMAKVYLGLFGKFKVAVETHNIVGCDGDASQHGKWTGATTRSLYSGILEGLMGIQCDLGGFGYVPCDVRGEMKIERFRHRQGTWAITIKGRGPCVRRFEIDGKPLAGTLKVPAEKLADRRSHILVIERGRQPFKRPTLLAAAGAAVCDIQSNGRQLSFSTTQRVHANCKLFCPSKPVVTCAGQPVSCTWDEQTHVAWTDSILEPGKRLQIMI